jgi:hypothetical protein
LFLHWSNSKDINPRPFTLLVQRVGL